MPLLKLVSSQNPRQFAVQILQQRRVHGEFTENLLDRNLGGSSLSPADRALCLEIVYGVVRRQGTLDWLIAWLLVAVLAAGVVATIGDDAPAGFFYFAVMPLAYACAAVPFALRRGARRGQSLGKQLLGIRVVDAEGDRLRASQILVREVLVKSLVLFGIAFLLAYVPLLIDLAMTLRDPQRRSIEDRVATTRVVGAGVPVTEPADAARQVLVAA